MKQTTETTISSTPTCKYLDELKQCIERFAIALDEICIVGSFSLALAGLRENNDIDLCISPAVRERLSTLTQGNDGFPKVDSKGTIDLSEHVQAKQNRYEMFEISDDEMIRTSRYCQQYDGIKVVRLELEFSYKLYKERIADLRDIPHIEAYALNNAESWDWQLVHSSRRSKQKVRPVKKGPRQVSLREVMKRPGKNVAPFMHQKTEQLLKALALLKPPTPDWKRFQEHVRQGWQILQHRDSLIHMFKHELILQYPTTQLFYEQVNSRGCNRYDTVVRYLAIENFYNKNDYGWDLYRKMQGHRGARKCIDTTIHNFSRLITQVARNGWEPTSKITLDANAQLVDGSHRLALALYHQTPTISVQLVSEVKEINYDIKWFQNAGFTDDELALINDGYDRILYQSGLLFPVILWPPAEPFFAEIQDKLGSEFQIYKTLTLQLNEATFREFVKDVYSRDNIAMWKIEKKLWGMASYPKNIHVLAIKIPAPQFRIKTGTQGLISVAGEHLKKKYRDAYQDKIPNYFYDIILHTGDNYTQNAFIWNTLSTYQNEHSGIQ